MNTTTPGPVPARGTPPMSTPTTSRTPTTSAGRATAGGRSHRGRPHLRSPLRKAVLVIHLLSAGAWIGIDVLVAVLVLVGWFGQPSTADRTTPPARSGEHTSELQSRGHLVCRLLLEKKKKTTNESVARIVVQ